MKKKNVIIPIIFVSLILSGCTPKYTPPHYDDKDYGYLLATFEGVNGALKVEKDYTTIISENVEKKIYPTNIKQEEISYEIETYNEKDEKITKTIKENVYAIYYGKERNDEEYRVSVTPTELKFVSLEKKVNNKFETVSLYTADAPYFAGTYNGVGEFEFDPYNNCVVIGNEFRVYDNAQLPGYDVYAYFNGNYMKTSLIAVPGFYLVQNSIVMCADFLDLSDGEFYGFTLFPHNDGNLYNILEGELYTGYYADPTMFLTTIVDDEGNVYKNDYELVYDDNFNVTGINATVNGKAATFSKSRSMGGVEYVFTFADQSTIKVKSAVDSFVFADGVEKHNYAPTSTAYELNYVENYFVTGDFENRLALYLDYDWDTDEETEVFKLNGTDVSDKQVYADVDGRVATSFKVSDKEYVLKKISDYIGSLEFDNVEHYVFNEGYYSGVFNKDFINPSSGLSVNINNFSYYINGGEGKKGELYYDESLNSVGFEMGNYRLFALDSDDGIYVLFQGELAQYMLLKSDYNNLAGTYTSNGTETVSFNEGKFYINSQEVPYTLTITAIRSGYKYAFVIGNYYLVPNFAGAIDVYIPNGDSLGYAGAYINASIFDSFKATYCLESSYGVENIKFTDDGKFLLDTPDGQGGLIRDVEYNYAFTSDGKRFSINAFVSSDTQAGAVPFVKAGYALVLEAANLFYIDSRLFELRGAYGDGSKNTLFFMEDNVYVNSILQTIKSLVKENNVTTITTNTHVITATFANDGSVTLKSRGVNEDESAAITYTDVDKKLGQCIGEKFVVDADTYFQVESSYSSITNAISLKVTKNGAMFSPSVYAIYDSEGRLVLRAPTPPLFGNYNLYYDGNNPVAVEVGK